MGRAPCCDKANVKRGPWSPEEDETLKSYIHKHGTGGNWIAFPEKAGLRRCGKSCRLRWLNYLRPGIKHGGFTDEEDNLICTLYSQMGSRWSLIASRLNGRTDNDVKNYWNTKLKKKLLATKSSNNTIPTDNPSISNVENYNLGFASTSLTQSSMASPQILTDVGYGLTVNTQSLIHDPFHFPYPGLTNVSEFSVSSSQEASSGFSGSPSLALDDHKCVSWSSNGAGDQDHDNGLLMDFGFGFPYDLINGGFWSTQEKASEVVPSTSSPSLVDSSIYVDIKPQGMLQSVINQY